MGDKPIYLYVTPFFPTPESWRGGYSLDTVKSLVRTGIYDVRVMTGGAGGDYAYDGVPVIRFRRWKLPCELAPFLTERHNRRLFRGALAHAGIDPTRVAVCHLNQVGYAEYGAEMKALSPKTVVKLQHHFQCPVHLRSGRLGRVPIHATLLYFHWRRLCETMDTHLFVSARSLETFWKDRRGDGPLHDLRDELLLGRFFRPLRSVPCEEAPIEIDRDLFKPGSRGEHMGFMIGCAANFQPFKGQMTLIKAVGLLHDRGMRNIRLRLVGTGQTRAMCERYVHERRLTGVISFEPERAHREMPEFYRSLDLFVLPSSREAFATVLAEAHACGTPILMCCADCGFAETLDSKEREAVSVPPEDERALAEKIAARIREGGPS